ncbi:MAG: DUF6265 family protein [Gemmatimonadota bacterium]
MRAARLLTAAMLLVPAASHAQGAPSNTASGDPVAGLVWLSGCWAQTTGARVVEEFWQAPRGGMMMGMGRTTNGPRLVEFEYMRIEGRGDTLVFVALPSGQAGAQFRARPPYDREVVFENPAHDFPQRVRYRRVGRDSVHARVEGMQNGASRGFDFRYARVSCPTGETSGPR